MWVRLCGVCSGWSSDQPRSPSIEFFLSNRAIIIIRSQLWLWGAVSPADGDDQAGQGGRRSFDNLFLYEPGLMICNSVMMMMMNEILNILFGDDQFKVWLRQIRNGRSVCRLVLLCKGARKTIVVVDDDDDVDESIVNLLFSCMIRMMMMHSECDDVNKDFDCQTTLFLFSIFL